MSLYYFHSNRVTKKIGKLLLIVPCTVEALCLILARLIIPSYLDEIGVGGALQPKGSKTEGGCARACVYHVAAAELPPDANPRFFVTERTHSHPRWVPFMNVYIAAYLFIRTFCHSSLSPTYYSNPRVLSHQLTSFSFFWIQIVKEATWIHLAREKHRAILFCKGQASRRVDDQQFGKSNKFL